MTTGVCGICGVMADLDDLLEHLREAHGEELQTWPDGKPVVIDHTLEPADFGSEECQHCKNGTYGPDSNGTYVRCYYCGGTGRVAV